MAIVEDVPETPSQGGYSTSTDIPLRHPSEIRRKPNSNVKSNVETDPEPLIKVPTPKSLPEGMRAGEKVDDEEDDPDGDFREEVFDTIMLTVPFTFLFILLHVLVHLQYGHRPSTDSILNGLLTAIPTLGISLFYSSRHASNPLTRGALMTASFFSGARLIWLVNKASWSVVTAQAPAMGTIWILTIVQLPLSRALICLAAVAGWVRWAGMSVYP